MRTFAKIIIFCSMTFVIEIANEQLTTRVGWHAVIAGVGMACTIWVLDWLLPKTKQS